MNSLSWFELSGLGGVGLVVGSLLGSLFVVGSLDGVVQLLGHCWARSSLLGHCSAILVIGLYVGLLGGVHLVGGSSCWAIAGLALHHWVSATPHHWGVVLGLGIEIVRCMKEKEE